VYTGIKFEVDDTYGSFDVDAHVCVYVVCVV